MAYVYTSSTVSATQLLILYSRPVVVSALVIRSLSASSGLRSRASSGPSSLTPSPMTRSISRSTMASPVGHLCLSASASLRDTTTSLPSLKPPRATSSRAAAVLSTRTRGACSIFESARCSHPETNDLFAGLRIISSCNIAPLFTLFIPETRILILSIHSCFPSPPRPTTKKFDCVSGRWVIQS